MSVTIDTADIDRVLRDLEGLKGNVRKGVVEAVQGAAVDVEREAKLKIQANKSVDEGRLISSISIRRFRRGLAATVGTTVSYAEAIEEGRGPHKPNWTSIKQWAERKGLSRQAAGAIWASIKKKGTKAKPFMVPAWEKVEPGFRSEFADKIGRKLP
tara:strand:+ start:1662 stop:2129 length:468 start_codon:yes stop_codon:yes gene_type:complete